MLSILARTRMASDEFLAWAMQRPEGERWELVGGELVGMSPERSGHALVKARVWWALDDAIKAMGLGCTASGRHGGRDRRRHTLRARRTRAL